MLQSVTLLGEKQRLSVPKGQLIAEVITGIEGPDGSQAMMRVGDPRYPRPHEHEPKRATLKLGETAVKRLLAVYSQLFVSGEVVDYDCTGFPLYVFGEIDEIRRDNFSQTHRVGGSVYPNDLVPGRPYAIINRAGDVVHSMIATGPLHSLSLMGRSNDGGGLMMRAANPHLMDIYDGASIHEITRNGERLDIDT